MSKRRPDPNATIQLNVDALDQVELIDNEAVSQPPPPSREPSSRMTPPPLPASTAMPGAPRARAGAGRTTASALIVVAVVAAAIAGGLFFGSRMRAQSSPGAASPGTGAAPSSSTRFLPTVEISKP